MSNLGYYEFYLKDQFKWNRKDNLNRKINRYSRNG
jgi:hypothetical protein